MKQVLFCALLLIPAAWAAGLAAEAAQQQQQQQAADIGFVLEMRGGWVTDATPRRPLVVGQSLPASAQVRPTGSPATNAITIVLLDGKRIACGGASGVPCSALSLPARLQPESSAWSRMVALIGGMFKREPTRYQPMISRSGEALAESVIALQNGSADLTAAFSQLKPGTYELVFKPVSDRAASKMRTTCAWDPAHPSQPLPAGIKPGLYRISIGSSPGSDAWCLLSDPGHFADRKARFLQAREVTDSWKLPANDPAVRTFLRAALETAASGN